MSILNRLVVATLPYVPRAIVGAVSRRYIAGVSLDDAVRQISHLNAQGFSTTTDLLGEYIQRIEEADQNRSLITDIYEAIERRSLRSTVSVKLSQMGLLIDREACYRNLRSLAATAKANGNRMTIDMEDSSTVDATLALLYRLRQEGFRDVSLVSQAYLRRAADDLRAFIRDGGGEVRLCKGIYIEPDSVALKGREEIRQNFLTLFDILVDGGCFVGIATHDEVLVDATMERIRARALPATRYEYQMLLGVREQLRDRIAAGGHPVRIYVPFGEHWYAYSVRRLRENPQIAGYVFRAMFRPPAFVRRMTQPHSTP